MRYYIGIDPGVSGAMVVLNPDGSIVSMDNFSGWVQMSSVLRNYEGASDVLVGLEKVHGMPGMSVKSVSSFMANFGGYLALLDCFKVPYVLPPPRTWMAVVLGAFPKGESKPRALAYAQRRWPSLNLKKSHHGIVDALCIAEYLIKTHGST